jgi:hypothetical protein
MCRLIAAVLLSSPAQASPFSPRCSASRTSVEEVAWYMAFLGLTQNAAFACGSVVLFYFVYVVFRPAERKNDIQRMKNPAFA